MVAKRNPNYSCCTFDEFFVIRYRKNAMSSAINIRKIQSSYLLQLEEIIDMDALIQRVAIEKTTTEAPSPFEDITASSAAAISVKPLPETAFDGVRTTYEAIMQGERALCGSYGLVHLLRNKRTARS
ncbi:hypothetical protein DFQ28_000971 [Apophysomyces sp. BC1034]|nr:hypothetical protein DFQ28_000971 [Apophysomyces sp. BC1034]